MDRTFSSVQCRRMQLWLCWKKYILLHWCKLLIEIDYYTVEKISGRSGFTPKIEILIRKSKITKIPKIMFWVFLVWSIFQILVTQKIFFSIFRDFLPFPSAPQPCRAVSSFIVFIHKTIRLQKPCSGKNYEVHVLDFAQILTITFFEDMRSRDICISKM